MSIDPKINAFDDCLERVMNGESPESAARRYPEWAAEFIPMLAAAQAARFYRNVQVPKAAMARSRARLLSAARDQRQPAAGVWTFRRIQSGLAAVALVLVLFFGGMSTFVVSAKALPGDTLYPLKLLSEQTRLFFTKDPSNRVNLELSYDRQRTLEVNALIRQGRSATVLFAGGLLRFNPELWLVDDVRVQIMPGTQITGELREGYYVGIEGLLQANGIVVARKIWTREYEVDGILLQVSTTQWQLDDISFTISPVTQIEGDLIPGRQATAYLAMRPDGSFEAQTVTVQVDATPTSTLAPSETATPHPTRTLIPPPTRQPDPTKTDLPVDSGRDQNDNQGNENENDSSNDNDNENNDDNENDNDNENDDGDENDNENDDDDENDNENDNDNENRPTRTPRPTDDDDDDDHDDEHENATPTPTPTQRQHED